MPSPPFDLDALHANVDFVRSLARRLTTGAADADDLAQQTWLTALRNPPPDAGRMRGWLATVVRTLAANVRRDDARRARRERATAAGIDAHAPDAATIVAREEARRRLLDAVMALAEPFRSTILLHHYEGLSTGAIARRTGVPAATVRTRLVRAHAKLRERLDERFGGSAATCAALAPWAAFGGLMTAKAWTTGAAALALLGWLGWLALGGGHDSGSLPLDASSAEVAANVDATSPTPPPSADERARVDVDPAAARIALASAYVVPTSPLRFPATRRTVALHGVVRTAQLAPAANVEVSLAPATGALPRSMAIDDDRDGARATQRTDADGRFTFASIPEGPYRLRVATTDGKADELVAATDGGDDVVIVLAAPFATRRLAVRVVGANGGPVEGADVEFVAPSTSPIRAHTDASGVVTFDVDGARQGLVIATHAATGGLGVLASIPAQFRVTLHPLGRIHGRLLGYDAATHGPLDVTVNAVSQTNPYFTTARRPFPVVVDGDRWHADALPAGTYVVGAASERGFRLDLPPIRIGEHVMPNTVEPRTVTLEPGATAECDLTLVRGADLTGVVRTDDGRPVVGAVVRAVLAPRTGNFTEGFVLHGAHVWRFDADGEGSDLAPAVAPRATTSTDGSYRLAGLAPGRYRVEVEAAGLHFDRREGVAVDVDFDPRLTHVLEPAGVLQAATRVDSYVGVVRAGDERPTMLAILPRAGVVTFPGLRAGRYEIAAFHSDESVPRRRLGEAVVAAGRTTFVDLRGDPDADGERLAGRFTIAGTPLVGAVVTHVGKTTTTDAHGAFTLQTGRRVGPRTGGWQFFVRTEDGYWSVTRASAAPFDLELGADVLRLVVVDAAGGAAKGRVRFDSNGRLADGTSIEAVRTVALDASGIVDVDGLVAGDAVAQITLDDGIRLSQRFVMPPPAPLRVVAPPTGRLRVRVIDADGAPVVGVDVEALDWRGDGAAPDDVATFEKGPIGVTVARSDAGGVATFAAVPAGSLLVRRKPPGGFALTRPASAAVQRLDVRAGGDAECTLQFVR